MLPIQFYKADTSTFVIKTKSGNVQNSGIGLSFFYNAATTSIAAIPITIQEAPFIFGLNTSDFQNIKIQGQATYQISEPELAAGMLNFNLARNGISYISEDPMKLNDVVIRFIQTLVQDKIQSTSLRNSLQETQSLVELIRQKLPQEQSLASMGITVIDVTITAITPTPETAKALEAEAREAVLKEADDAIYSRRKSAVEQERTIKEAELQTTLSVQQKEQEIEESRLDNERKILREEIETETERLKAETESEKQRNILVTSSVENRKLEADAEAYAIDTRMKAFTSLPVENLKAMAIANMQPEQLMAMAFESLAQNANKIGELNISPDLFNQFASKVNRSRSS